MEGGCVYHVVERGILGTGNGKGDGYFTGANDEGRLWEGRTRHSQRIPTGL